MTAANPLTEPDREIPLREIPAALSDYRAKWAEAYTRAETLERQLADAKQAAADWQGIALENGERAAQLGVTLARIQKAADEAPSDVDRLRAEKVDLLDQLAKVCLERDRLIREKTRLLAKRESDKGFLAAYRDSLVTIYEATAGQTGPLVDLIHTTMRELADGDLDDDDPMFDTCQTCGPFDRDYNPMPGCRDCFGGKVVR